VDCIVGKSYPTRLGRLHLLERPDVSRLLVEIPEELALPIGDADMRVHPRMLACLQTWLEEMAKFCQGRAGAQNTSPTFGKLYLTSAYRALGTTAGYGEYADCCGALDSQDDYGHWSGWAIDCPTRTTRESFSPIITIEECRLSAERAGLVRPFAEEWWHFRPRREIIPDEG